MGLKRSEGRMKEEEWKLEMRNKKKRKSVV